MTHLHPVGSHPRIWLITGANSGFGAAFTRAALDAGDTVVTAVRRPETMAGLAAEFPERVAVVTLDVRDPIQCQQAVEDALAQHGRIDVLVNNAGYGVVGAVEETTENELCDAFEVMFHAPLRLTRLVLPHMGERRSGAIVQVSSMGGLLEFLADRRPGLPVPVSAIRISNSASQQSRTWARMRCSVRDKDR
jgi:NAD(P)-dependent dehydrogenase (short-subunit alcohol dehydrogenase family)